MGLNLWDFHKFVGQAKRILDWKDAAGGCLTPEVQRFRNLHVVLSNSSWNRSWRSSPSVWGSSSSEAVPKSNSSASQCRGASALYAVVGSYSGVGSRLSGIESREEAEEL